MCSTQTSTAPSVCVSHGRISIHKVTLASSSSPVLMHAKRLVITSDGSLRQQQRCNSGATVLAAPFIRGSRHNAMAGRSGDCGYSTFRQHQCTTVKAAQKSGAAPVQETSLLFQLDSLRFEGPDLDLRSLFHKSLRDSLQEKPSRSIANEHHEVVSLAVLDFFDQVEKELNRTIKLAVPLVLPVQDLVTLVQLPVVFLKVRSLHTFEFAVFQQAILLFAPLQLICCYCRNSSILHSRPNSCRRGYFPNCCFMCPIATQWSNTQR